MDYDFSGWATRANLRCSDGRIIMHDAFKDNDGKTVPLVWNHEHNDPSNTLGKVTLHNMDDGVYAYGYFNDTEKAHDAKIAVQHGDINALSICANQLQHNGNCVMHGNIREVSLVYAGANPGAFIDYVIEHGDKSESEATIYTGLAFDYGEIQHSDDSETEKKSESESIDESNDYAEIEHSDNKTVADVINTMTDEQKKAVYLSTALAMIGGGDIAIEHSSDESDDDSKIGDIINTLNEEQKNAALIMMAKALEISEETNKSEKDEGGNVMKKNIFENENRDDELVLEHSDELEIIGNAKSSSCGSLKSAIEKFARDHGSNDDMIKHGFDSIETLFPEYHDVKPGAPEIVGPDVAWVDAVMKRVHKSPYSRIRTRQADVAAVRAGGYKTKGSKKADAANTTFSGRTTDPQTIYIKDKLNRDDIIDITDFDVVAYQWAIMRQSLNNEIARAILVGDGRTADDEQKIDPVHVRPIWQDDEMYTIHVDVDTDAQKTELQGTDTGANFGENYIVAEAIITAALYAREQYKGSGAMSFWCTPHILNVMLLAKDMNGRRIYNSKADIAAALDVREIHTVEAFEGLTRTAGNSGEKTKELLGIFVNLSDYQVGAVRKGEITQFSDFDIDFNQEKYLIETRMSGALTHVKSAIALEKDVTVI